MLKENKIKTALVTGAASGIGLACVEYLIEEDYRVFAGVRKKSDFQKLLDMGATPILLDVCNEEQITEAYSLISQKCGSLDLLVNNAGYVVAGPIELVPLQKIREQFDVNVFGAISVIQHFLPLLRSAKGMIVNMSSIAGRVASPYLAPYSSSKFALEAISDGLRRELRYFGVRVVLIEPGPVATPIWEKSKKTNDMIFDNSNKQLKSLYEKPMLRFSEEAEKAEKSAVPVNEVVSALHNAIHSTHPKTRYLIGRRAKFANLLASLLPDKLLDRLF